MYLKHIGDSIVGVSEQANWRIHYLASTGRNFKVTQTLYDTVRSLAHERLRDVLVDGLVRVREAPVCRNDLVSGLLTILAIHVSFANTIMK